jgi:predicted acetyltransferase
MADLTTRVLTPDEFPLAARLVSATMLSSVADDVINDWATFFEDETTHGAIAADGAVAGIARWFETELSLAGPSLPAAGVTAVAVLPTHRRQGHLRRLMEAQLESIASAEVPIALLVAAEWPIYGRYGYGPAISACGYEIDASISRFTAARTGTIELVTSADLRPHLEAMHDQRWARTMGAVKRKPQIWERIAGVSRWPGDSDDPGQARGALWRDDSGDVQGAVAYRVEEKWTRNRPTGKLNVQLLVGATPEAERELWRHLCDTDWVTTVNAGNRAVDDPVQLLFDDGRAAAQVDTFDCIWARILDVPRAFGARRADRQRSAVVEVVDDLEYAAGRWAITLGPDGGEAVASKATPDARLPIKALGAALFGGTSVTRMHHAGWLDEESPGGVARVDDLLHTATAPWSPTTY